MLSAIIIAILQAGAAPGSAAEAPPAAQEAPVGTVPSGMMDCQYDRGTRVRTCTTSEGEVLRCRRERALGSRFPTMVCFTHEEDQQVQNDSRTYLDRQQTIAPPSGN